MPGIDANTVLMLHFNGTDGATTFTDSSASGHVVTASGNAQIDTAQSKFGGASALFDGTTDYLTIPDSNDFYFSSDFTIDFWLRFNATSSFRVLDQANGGDQVIFQYVSGTGWYFQVYNGGLVVNASWAWTPSTATWYHVALTKSGSTYDVWINGTKLTGSNNVDASAVPNVAGTPYFFANYLGGASLNGWVDEFRISKVCRWTATFTPPTAEYEEEAPPEPIDLGTPKNRFFADKAALLDSNCQVYIKGSFDLTVPEGETWYIFNAWFVQSNDGKAFFHRSIGVDQAMIAPPGTRLKSMVTHSFIWYARPFLVQEDEIYQEAEDLYYDRLNKIKLQTAKAANAYRAAYSSAVSSASFDNTMDEIIITHISTHGGCWTTLDGGSVGVDSVPQRIVNTLDEINDGHEIRFTGSVIQPFKRSMFDRITLGLGNRSDSYGVAHTEDTWGCAHYVEKPDNF